MKITILDTNTVTNGDVSLTPIEKLGEVHYYDLIPHNKLAKTIGDSDAVIINKANITDAVFSVF